jgi:hypothetical protein
MKRVGLALTIWVLVVTTAGCAGPTESAEDRLLPPSQQLEVRENWLETRHEMLLEMMRRHGVGMWIIVNEEFHDDPMTEFVAPPEVYVGGRDLFVFIGTG